MSGMISVAIGILVERLGDRDQVLITRRLQGAVLGGYWEFPGGKLEVGETPGQCLAREFVEELGLEIEVGQALPTIEHQYPHGRVKLHPFMCTRRSGEPRPIGVAEHKWVRADELDRYPFPPANEQLVAHLKSALMGNVSNQPRPSGNGHV